MGPCTYCGFCEWFGCGNYSKASPQTTILPVLVRKSNFSARDNCEVTQINLDRSGKRATGVTFVDSSGEEWEQPADLVILSAFSLFNVQLLLLSKIGQPYDPATNTGVIGRNFTHQTMSSVNGFFDKSKFNFNPFIASGAIGMMHRRVQRRQFRSRPASASSAAAISAMRRPTAARSPRRRCRPARRNGARIGRRRWPTIISARSAGRRSTAASTAIATSISTSIRPIADRFGRPLMRMTIDFHDNELKAAAYLTDKLEEIVQGDGRGARPRRIRARAPTTVTTYQTTHLNGGAIMGTDPKTSALNRYLQHWDVPNLFVMGASAFPQNAGYNPTGTVAALAFWSAKAIREQYLKKPGPLVDA